MEEKKRYLTTKQIATVAIIAALKLALNYVFHGISFGPFNFRVSNGLIGALPYMGEAGIVAFFIAGMWTNLSSPLGIFDLLTPFIALPFNYIIVLAGRTKKGVLVLLSMILYGVSIGIYVGWMLNFYLGLPMIPMMINVAVSNTAMSAGLAYLVYQGLQNVPESWWK